MGALNRMTGKLNCYTTYALIHCPSEYSANFCERRFGCTKLLIIGQKSLLRSFSDLTSPQG